MIGSIRNWLIDSSVATYDVDSPEFSIAHREVVLRKRILRELFEGFYHECEAMDSRYFRDVAGERLEIGSGAGIISEVYPEVITSDLKVLPFIDVALSAYQLPFRDNSLRAIYGINVFHHLSQPRDFFREMIRAIAPGGGAVLIEPFYGLVAGWMFRNLHKTEGFEPNEPEWEGPPDSGPFSKANQALSYIIFKRDLNKFEKEFPELEVVLMRPHTQLWYILSGGVNFKQLVPDSLTGVATFAEKMFSPLNRWIALQHTIVIRKRR